jgi:hypothetical protein
VRAFARPAVRRPRPRTKLVQLLTVRLDRAARSADMFAAVANVAATQGGSQGVVAVGCLPFEQERVAYDVAGFRGPEARIGQCSSELSTGPLCRQVFAERAE